MRGNQARDWGEFWEAPLRPTIVGMQMRTGSGITRGTNISTVFAYGAFFIVQLKEKKKKNKKD